MKTYDKQCLELAQSFLGDCDSRKPWGSKEFEVVSEELAIEIQQTIEDFMEIRGLST